MDQGSRLLKRTVLKNLIRMVPAAILIAATINTLSCNTGGLLQEVNGNKSPTATPTAGTGALGFVSNFNSGDVASFTRNTATGVLKRTSTVAAGKKKGPKGLAISSGGGFLYVANKADDNIYEYSVNQNNGTLTPLSNPAFVSNGAASGPDEIAINPAGTFLFVTGFRDGTVTTYSINAGTGQLTQAKQVKGLSNPWGIAVDSTGSFVFVAENGAGVVTSFSIGANGTLTKINSIFDLGAPGGTPGFIALDPGGAFLYVTDQNAGLIAVLGVSSGTLSFGQLVPGTTSARMPLGIGYATLNSGNFIYTANQGTATMWSFLLTTPGNPSQPVEFGMTDGLSTPTGLVVDPQNAFMYTTNQTAGTVSQFSLNPTCAGAPGPPCFVKSTATDTTGSGSGPFAIILTK